MLFPFEQQIVGNDGRERGRVLSIRQCSAAE